MTASEWQMTVSVTCKVISKRRWRAENSWMCGNSQKAAHNWGGYAERTITFQYVFNKRFILPMLGHIFPMSINPYVYIQKGHHQPSLTGLQYHDLKPPLGPPCSRAGNFHACLGPNDHVGRIATGDISAARVAFQSAHKVGTRKYL